MELSSDEVVLGFDCLSTLSPEVSGLVLSFLSGRELAAAEASLPEWHKTVLNKESWWSERCLKEFGSIPHTANLWSDCWRRKYQQLYGASHPTHATWCYSSCDHGLEDRVAQPQLFIGPRGQKMFCYGGWTEGGAVNDLHSVPLKEMYTRCQQNSAPSASRAAAAAAPEEEPREREQEGFRFQEVETQGKPVYPAGVQTLTPIWFNGDAPTQAHVLATYESFVSSGCLTRGKSLENKDMSMVIAFGGAQGGYRNEHNRYAVGILSEGQQDSPSSIVWGRPKECPDSLPPTARAAHTATYVPARFLPAHEYPEGAVVIFGGHTDDTSVELSSIEVLALHSWSWQRVDPRGVAPRPRHGHTGTLVEVDGKGYLVFVGGGVGNILGSGRVAEFGDVAILDCQDWSWLGGPLQMSWAPTEEERAAPPKQGRHHTACVGLRGQILLYGGGHRPDRPVRVLDGKQCVELAKAGEESITVSAISCYERPGSAAPAAEEGAEQHWGEASTLPEGRKMHGAVSLLPFAPCLVVYGGWNTGPHFSDLWILGLGCSQRELRNFAALPPIPTRERPRDIDDFFPGAAFHGGALRHQLVMMMLQHYREQRGGQEEDDDEEEEEDESEGGEDAGQGDSGSEGSNSSDWQVPHEYGPL
mmetsp:Transcript_41607/g.75450  ORF Transcript_41607/g.75450 Transcript_41607/m.75450 type:complete len:643 (-) Transcript_41607:66-1994(-)